MSYHFQSINNRLNNLPDELINYIYDFIKDDSFYKTFVKSFTTYHAIYNHIRKRTALNKYIKFSDANTLKIILTDQINKNWKTMLYYYIDSDNIYIDYTLYEIITIQINENNEHNITLISYTPDEDSDNEETINKIIEIDSDDEE